MRGNPNRKTRKFIEKWSLLASVIVTLGALAVYDYFEDQSRYEGVDEARSNFARMTLPQAMQRCLALANDVRTHPSLAFAWQPGALDWYVMEGADNASMRHYACDGASVTEGKRYERVMLTRVALEGPRPGSGEMAQNLFDRYAGFSEATVRALEVTEDPLTHKLIERRWLASGSAQLSEPLANELPILLGHVPAGLATALYPQRVAREPIDWSTQPDAVFALLAKHVLPTQRIGELYFAQKTIYVTLVGPVEVQAQPPAAFGQLNFDAYGVADHATWEPTMPNGNTCKQGRSLSEIKALFAQVPKPQNFVYAWFDCDPLKAHGNLGDWYLRDTRTRKEHLPPGRH